MLNFDDLVVRINEDIESDILAATNKIKRVLEGKEERLNKAKEYVSLLEKLNNVEGLSINYPYAMENDIVNDYVIYMCIEKGKEASAFSAIKKIVGPLEKSSVSIDSVEDKTVKVYLRPKNDSYRVAFSYTRTLKDTDKCKIVTIKPEPYDSLVCES